MSQQNPQIADQLRRAKEELTQLKGEKGRLYPANPHPFVQPDEFPGKYTTEQIQHRNNLIARIEQLEKQIEDLQNRLYLR